MRLDVQYKNVADIDECILDEFNSLIKEEHWVEYKYRANLFGTVENTPSTPNLYDSIMLRHHIDFCKGKEEPTNPCIENYKFFDYYFPVLDKILNRLSEFYVIDDYTSLLCNLRPGGQLAMHCDGGVGLEDIHRVHIPITTNPEAWYFVEDTQLNMLKGRIYEIDNQRFHGIHNVGQTDRIHLLVNIYGSPKG